MILGPLFSESVIAASNVTRAARVPMIAFSSDLEAAGDGVFTATIADAFPVDRPLLVVGLNTNDRALTTAEIAPAMQGMITDVRADLAALGLDRQHAPRIRLRDPTIVRHLQQHRDSLRPAVVCDTLVTHV